MKLIIGLGNPGKEYRNTRHNMGFMVLDALANEYGLAWKKDTARKAEVARNESVLLAKPRTFMNESGEAAQKLVHFYKIDLRDMLVIYDDIDLMLGQTRQRSEGSAGGHQGMQSVIDTLGTQAIARLRVGIAEEQTGKQAIPSEAYVLQPFSDEVKESIEDVIAKTMETAMAWIKE